MAGLKVASLTRVFRLKRNSGDINLPDPNPTMTAEEVAQFYATQYPELQNAKIPGANFEADQAVYEFETTVGVKG